MFLRGFLYRRTFLFGGHKWVCEWRPKLSARTVFSLHITAGAPQKANVPITGRESQLCCVFNLRGPIWRHHRVMWSDTFSVLIAAAPVARLPKGCSGQEGHKHFLMSINLITVLSKHDLSYGDRWIYFPPQKENDKLKDIPVSLIICLLGNRTCLVSLVIFESLHNLTMEPGGRV